MLFMIIINVFFRIFLLFRYDIFTKTGISFICTWPEDIDQAIIL